MNFELCRKFFAQYRNYTLYAGFSGGADSTAALLAALHFKEEFGFDLRAVHFDHHLRGRESDADVIFCRSFAQNHDIEITVIDLELSSGGGLEERARLARLEHWKHLAGNRKNCAVILGHHGDDRIENFFLRMIRGANLGGLISPKSASCVDGVHFIRPLLGLSRQEIEQYLAENGVHNWRSDSTNAVADCSRNRIRLEILPALYALFPGARTGIRHCLEHLEEDADFIEKTALKNFDPVRLYERAYWQSLHPAVLARVMRIWLDEIPSRQFLLAVKKELSRTPPEEPRIVVCSADIQLVFQGGEVYLKSRQIPSAAVWDLHQNIFVWGDWTFEVSPAEHALVSSKFEAVFDADEVGETLCLAPPLPGEEMSVFGSEKRIRIKKLRVDSRTPAHYALPVVKNAKGEIIWAPGIKHSSHGVVTGETEKMIRLKASSAKFRIGIGID